MTDARFLQELVNNPELRWLQPLTAFAIQLDEYAATAKPNFPERARLILANLKRDVSSILASLQRYC